MANNDKLTIDQIKNISEKLSEGFIRSGVTIEEAAKRANELGQVIDKYYKDHPEEYAALMRRTKWGLRMDRNLVIKVFILGFILWGLAILIFLIGVK